MNTTLNINKNNSKREKDKIIPIADSRYLSSSGRKLDVPFCLRLEMDKKPIEIICNRVVRILPLKRVVCYGEYNNQPVVIKIFLNPQKSERHSRREEKGINALANAGIKTPTLLIRGIIKPDMSSVLVFKRIEPSLELSTVWEQAENNTQCKELLCKASGIIADLHNKGLIQNDLHLNNFLMSDKNEIYTIDGDTIDTDQAGNPLSMAKSLDNLGLFFAQFYPEIDTLVPEVFRAYLKQRELPFNTGLLNSLYNKIKIRRAKREKNYLKKIFRECSDYICHKSWKYFLVYNRDEHSEEMVSFLENPDKFIKKGRMLKDGNSSTVVVVTINNRKYVVKRYNIKNFIHALKRCFRSTRAWKSWKNAHRLNMLGIDTPKPIALLEKRWGVLRCKAYFVTEYIEGTDAYHLIHSGKLKENALKIFADQFIKIFKQLINALITHGDFKATNFIPSEGKMYVIDLDALRTHHFKGKFQRALKKDLKRFMKNWKDLPGTYEMFDKKISDLCV